MTHKTSQNQKWQKLSILQTSYRNLTITPYVASMSIHVNTGNPVGKRQLRIHSTWQMEPGLFWKCNASQAFLGKKWRSTCLSGTDSFGLCKWTWTHSTSKGWFDAKLVAPCFKTLEEAETYRTETSQNYEVFQHLHVWAWTSLTQKKEAGLAGGLLLRKLCLDNQAR